MKQIIKAIFMVTCLGSFGYAQYCDTTYHCKKHINKKTLKPELTCTLPAMPTFTITAPDVIDSNGKLKRYWNEGKTVCDVLGWMNEAVPYLSAHYSNINTSITTPLTLSLSCLEGSTDGGVTGTRRMHPDADIKDEGISAFSLI